MKVEKNNFFVKSDGSQNIAVNSYFLNGNESKSPLVLFPAMGIPGKFYVKVALELAKAGNFVYVVDLRGSGESGPVPSKKNDFGYSDLIYKDWPSVLETIRSKHPNKKPIVIGHSLGGQLSSIYAGLFPTEIQGLILVATGTPFFKHFPILHKFIFLSFYGFSWLLSSWLGYFPGDKLKVMGRNARQLMKDWSKVGMTGTFRDSEGKSLEGVFASIVCPVLCISFSDDTYAPKKPVEALLGRIGASDITRHHVDPEDEGVSSIGHLGWMKNANLVSVRILEWTKEKIK
ncbi:alpha/beta fold hydrolase [Leptospira sp. 201903071]|uniref:alpha/beta hydrolase family protein n=1 Tax=Leptospira ainazelensis TaxID=2810034 RepID=UPI001962C391|nr:alpha/beta fold hydrolase [Leptospira ainazelensis]MBM9500935.1 alpha/beta fold hydrolase [Leptospira ainazelensis]